MSLATGMDDPEFLLNRGTERREVAIAATLSANLGETRNE